MTGRTKFFYITPVNLIGFHAVTMDCNITIFTEASPDILIISINQVLHFCQICQKGYILPIAGSQNLSVMGNTYDALPVKMQLLNIVPTGKTSVCTQNGTILRQTKQYRKVPGFPIHIVNYIIIIQIPSFVNKLKHFLLKLLQKRLYQTVV